MGARARRRARRDRLARLSYRLRTWVGLRLCYGLGLHAWTPWQRHGWSSRYIDRVKVFEGHVYSRRCRRCGGSQTKDA